MPQSSAVHGVSMITDMQPSSRWCKRHSWRRKLPALSLNKLVEEGLTLSFRTADDVATALYDAVLSALTLISFVNPTPWVYRRRRD